LSIWLSLPGQPIRNRAIFIPWVASAAPGNTRRRQAADIYCNLRRSVLPGKKRIMTQYSSIHNSGAPPILSWRSQSTAAKQW
jgi:hypothetical protein